MPGIRLLDAGHMLFGVVKIALRTGVRSVLSKGLLLRPASSIVCTTNETRQNARRERKTREAANPTVPIRSLIPNISPTATRDVNSWLALGITLWSLPTSGLLLKRKELACCSGCILI